MITLFVDINSCWWREITLTLTSKICNKIYNKVLGRWGQQSQMDNPINLVEDPKANCSFWDHISKRREKPLLFAAMSAKIGHSPKTFADLDENMLFLRACFFVTGCFFRRYPGSKGIVKTFSPTFLDPTF